MVGIEQSEKPKDLAYDIETADWYVSQAIKKEAEGDPNSRLLFATAGEYIYHLPEGPTLLFRIALNLEPYQSNYLLLGYASMMTVGLLYEGETPSYLTAENIKRRKQTRNSIHRLLKGQLRIAKDFLRYRRLKPAP